MSYFPRHLLRQGLLKNIHSQLREKVISTFFITVFEGKNIKYISRPFRNTEKRSDMCFRYSHMVRVNLKELATIPFKRSLK